MSKLVPIRRFFCVPCDKVFLAPSRKTPKTVCVTCQGAVNAISPRGPAPTRGGRNAVESPHSVTLGVRVTEDVASEIDLYRGARTRSEWLRAAINETLMVLHELDEDAPLTFEDGTTT